MKWREAKGKGAQVFPTGFGKTYGTITQIIKPFLIKDNFRRIIVLVHRVKLQKQWQEQITELIPKDLVSCIEVMTVQTYVANSSTDECDLLIVDELHKFYADEYINFVNGNRIKFTFNLGLTATYKDKKGNYIKLKDIYPVIDVITQEEALENGWISKFIEFNLPIELTDEEAVRYKEAIEDIAMYESKLQADNSYQAISRAQKLLYGGDDAHGRHYTAIAWAMMFAKANGWSADLEKDNPINLAYNPQVIMGYAKNLFKGYRTRDGVIQHAKAKYTATIEILRKFKHLKAMCFSESTTFADKLAQMYNFRYKDDRCIVFHSQLPSMPMKDETGEFIVYKSGKRKGERKLFGIDSIKKHTIDQFVNNKGNCRILSTARLLDEGFDCEDIRMGIITSRSSNHNQQIQRGGRVKRIVPDAPNETMLIINIYAAKTDDERRLYYAQKEYTHKVIPVSCIDDIDFDAIGDDEIDVNQL